MVILTDSNPFPFLTPAQGAGPGPREPAGASAVSRRRCRRTHAVGGCPVRARVSPRAHATSCPHRDRPAIAARAWSSACEARQPSATAADVNDASASTPTVDQHVTRGENATARVGGVQVAETKDKVTRHRPTRTAVVCSVVDEMDDTRKAKCVLPGGRRGLLLSILLLVVMPSMTRPQQ